MTLDEWVEKNAFHLRNNIFAVMHEYQIADADALRLIMLMVRDWADNPSTESLETKGRAE